jgi:hypothetical protein
VNVLIGPATGTSSTTTWEGGEDTLESVVRGKGCIAKGRRWVGNGFRGMEHLKGLVGSSGSRSEMLHLKRLCSVGERTKGEEVVDGSRQMLGRGARAYGRGAFKSGGDCATTKMMCMAGADTAAASTRRASVNQHAVGQGEESIKSYRKDHISHLACITCLQIDSFWSMPMVPAPAACTMRQPNTQKISIVKVRVLCRNEHRYGQ